MNLPNKTLHATVLRNAASERWHHVQMELLIRNRSIFISGLFLSLGGIGVGAYLDKQAIFAAAAIAAHVCLFLFTTTESFGRIASTRASAARILARIFFGMYVLAGVGFVVAWASTLDHV